MKVMLVRRDTVVGRRLRCLAWACPALIAGFLLWSLPQAVGQAQADNAGYSDIESSPYRDSILYLAGRRVLIDTDCGPGRFCPDDLVDRQTVAVWLIRLLNEDSLPTTPSRFADVDPDSFGADEIERLAELGITNGCGQEPARFCPDRQVSRSHLAAFLVRAYDLQPGDSIPDFIDVDPNSWTAGLIGALASHGLDFGCNQPGPRYCPSQLLTRGELADLIYRVNRRLFGLKPESPWRVHAARDDAGQLFVRWRPSRRGVGPDPVAYRVQWWADDEGFGSARQVTIDDPNRLWYLVSDVGPETTYSVRVRAVNQIAVSSASLAVSELEFSPQLLSRRGQSLTETESEAVEKMVYDRLWLHMEQKFLPTYEVKHPWLRINWNHVKNKTGQFTACLRPSDCSEASIWASVKIACRPISKLGNLPRCWVNRLVFRRQHVTNNWLIAHELGHVLTLANEVVDRPEPIAMAFIYFVDLAREDESCIAGELYADTIEALVVGFDWTNYWEKCRLTPDNPSNEALAVVRQALAGETPDWFVSHYGLAGGGLDYQAIWDDADQPVTQQASFSDDLQSVPVFWRLLRPAEVGRTAGSGSRGISPALG